VPPLATFRSAPIARLPPDAIVKVAPLLTANECASSSAESTVTAWAVLTTALAV
jgi:hypothetical protein